MKINTDAFLIAVLVVSLAFLIVVETNDITQRMERKFSCKSLGYDDYNAQEKACVLEVSDSESMFVKYANVFEVSADGP